MSRSKICINTKIVDWIITILLVLLSIPSGVNFFFEIGDLFTAFKHLISDVCIFSLAHVGSRSTPTATSIITSLFLCVRWTLSIFGGSTGNTQMMTAIMGSIVSWIICAILICISLTRKDTPRNARTVVDVIPEAIISDEATDSYDIDNMESSIIPGPMTPPPPSDVNNV